jgi:uncharacterized iron-regulated protein
MNSSAPRLVCAIAFGLCLVILGERTVAQDTTLPPPPQSAGWASSHGTDHVLVGRIWRPSTREFIDEATLISDLHQATFILLGEVHDNPDHHRLQAWIVAALASMGRRPSVAFEMLSTDQEAALKAYLRERPNDATGLGDAVDWERTGWLGWQMYKPIAQSALDGGMPILPANLSRATIAAIAEQGLQVLGTSQVSALRLDEPLPSESLDHMRRDLAASHCQMLPRTMIDDMASILFARDAFMAAAMARGATVTDWDGAVLIAGSGHVRTDRGVPWHLARLAPGRSIASVGLIEVADDDHTMDIGRDTLPFDYVWFTPRAKGQDPCEGAPDRLKRAKERHEQTDG